MQKLLLILLVLAALITACDGKTVIEFGATLSTAKEVPPVSGASSGTFLGTLDRNTKSFAVVGAFKDLTGAATVAHIHGPALANANADPILTLSVQAGASVGTGSLSGTFTLTDLQIADLDAGKWYVNVHTTANPGGEIRGQISK